MWVCSDCCGEKFGALKLAGVTFGTCEQCGDEREWLVEIAVKAR
jgi:hypothetical protein